MINGIVIDKTKVWEAITTSRYPDDRTFMDMMQEVERQIAEQFQPGSVIEYDPKKGFPRLDSRTQDPDRALKAQMAARMVNKMHGPQLAEAIEYAENIVAEIDRRFEEKGK